MYRAHALPGLERNDVDAFVNNEEKKPKPTKSSGAKTSESVNQKKKNECIEEFLEISGKSKQKPAAGAGVETPEESSHQQPSNQIRPSPKKHAAAAAKKVNKNKVSPIIDDEEIDETKFPIFGPGCRRAKLPPLPANLRQNNNHNGNVYAIQPTQNASTLEVLSTQNTGTQGTITDASLTGSEKPFAPKQKQKQQKLPPPPFRPKQQQVKKQYKPAGPYDYHAKEPEIFGPSPDMLRLPAKCIPELKRYGNFWSIISKICVPKRPAPVFVNPVVDGTNVWFMVRDLVADEKKYATFLKLPNRILETQRNDRPDYGTPKKVPDSKRLYILRVFIISYYPLTLEVHCRGPCPLFLYYLFECENCIMFLERLQQCDWFMPPGTSSYDWDKFVCRVKQTPINSHLFTCYRGIRKQYPEDVNHIFVIRGDCESKKLCACSRGCVFERNYHPNGFIIDAERQIPTTTQTTQATTDY
uniref:Spaetzle domain-containing protein n=1 Tax=Panagrolaimus sp. ES5 TaxID=591445 RepID=A0AC34FRM9_9BILA